MFLHLSDGKLQTVGRILLALLFLGTAFAGTRPVQATPPPPTPTQETIPVTPTPTPGGEPSGTNPVSQNQDCMMCHSDPRFNATFADGERLSMNVDLPAYQRSVHSAAGLQCVACHTGNTSYPHELAQVGCQTCHLGESGKPQDYTTLEVRIEAPSKRAFVLGVNETCRKCHAEKFVESRDSAHAKVMDSGNDLAPACVDCHGGHEITPPDQPRSKIAKTCSVCHLSVYTTYRSSVHGAALEEHDNPDVPTCTDCHGVHNVRGPRDPKFHNDVPTMCGRCHGNPALMAKYGISTDVFQTYEADFHGKTVELFRRQSPNLPSNKAVCYDCHGIHNIRRVDDPKSTVAQANLLNTCRQCHTEAGFRFPAAWSGHFPATWNHYPILFIVNTGYQILIATLIGGFLVYIALDAQRRWRDTRKVKRNV